MALWSSGWTSRPKSISIPPCNDAHNHQINGITVVPIVPSPFYEDVDLVKPPVVSLSRRMAGGGFGLENVKMTRIAEWS